jgi:hypothetical protein
MLLTSLSISQTTYGNDVLQEKKSMMLSEKLVDLPLIEVGNAKFSVFFWDIYQSKLFTPTGNYYVANNTNNLAVERPLLFKIKYLRDISQKDLIERTIEQWKHLNFNQKNYSSYVPQLKTIWPNIEAGDSLALLISNNKSDFYFNNHFIGSIPEENFGKLFLAIWLSPNTSQPELRKKLINEK